MIFGNVISYIWNLCNHRCMIELTIIVRNLSMHYCCIEDVHLTHWGRVTPLCVSKLTIIGSDYGLSSGRRQTIIWTNDGILLVGPLGTNFSEILIETYKCSFKKMHLKMSSGKWWPFCLGLNVLTFSIQITKISMGSCNKYVTPVL